MSTFRTAQNVWYSIYTVEKILSRHLTDAWNPTDSKSPFLAKIDLTSNRNRNNYIVTTQLLSVCIFNFTPFKLFFH